MITSILIWIVLGLLAGSLARLIIPGDQNYSLPVTILLGIVGAVVGGWISRLIFKGDGGAGAGSISISSVIVAALGAILVVWIYGLVMRASRKV